MFSERSHSVESLEGLRSLGTLGALIVFIVVCCVFSAAPSHAQEQSAEPGTDAIRQQGRLIHVGPQREIRTLAAAAQVARDGDTIAVDPGDYPGDVAVWTRDNLTIRAVSGRARLVASGASAEHKAIWVARGGSLVVENIDFVGARVPDQNGAGIRLERGRLLVRNCRFMDNENGILTGGDKSIELEIEGSEFGHNGAGDGLSHNLYAGTIARLKVTGSYFHHARGGHLLKSRAAENFILYNRLTDEAGGQASYELEFPNGGTAYVIGNIIQQGAQTENPHLIAFGAEGYSWPRNELYLVHNTLVDDRPGGGIFLRVAPGAGQVRLVNNLLLGKGLLEPLAMGAYLNNQRMAEGDFASAGNQDYRLKKAAKLAGKLVDPGNVNGVNLAPEREYVHPQHTRALGHAATLPGAFQSRAP